MKHNHYFKSVRGLESIDVYRVLALFGVTDPCLQHAVKKLLCAGYRGSKGFDQDVQEAIDTLARWRVMRKEDEPFADELTVRFESGTETHKGIKTMESVTQCGDGVSVGYRLEPAAQMDDDSERMAAIGQNGNDGEHYYSDKPKWSDAPEWAMWLAQDPDGHWFWFHFEPVFDGLSGWMAAPDEQVQQIYYAHKSTRPASAKKTLERRP